MVADDDVSGVATSWSIAVGLLTTGVATLRSGVGGGMVDTRGDAAVVVITGVTGMLSEEIVLIRERGGSGV